MAASAELKKSGSAWLCARDVHLLAAIHRELARTPGAPVEDAVDRALRADREARESEPCGAEDHVLLPIGQRDLWLLRQAGYCHHEPVRGYPVCAPPARDLQRQLQKLEKKHRSAGVFRRLLRTPKYLWQKKQVEGKLSGEESQRRAAFKDIALRATDELSREIHSWNNDPNKDMSKTLADFCSRKKANINNLTAEQHDEALRELRTAHDAQPGDLTKKLWGIYKRHASDFADAVERLCHVKLERMKREQEEGRH